MTNDLEGNILAIQTGTPTAVSNAILSGVITEALNHGEIEEVFGALGGLEGLLKGDLIDLAEESQQVVRGLRHTPLAALGSSDFVIKGDDIDQALSVIEKFNVRFIVVVGEVALLASLETLVIAAKAKGYDVRIVGIPQSLSNTIATTDHSLGYGSAAKAIASRVKEVVNQQFSQYNHDNVAILQLDDVENGWMVAASTVCKQRNKPEDYPHLVLLPEIRFNPQSVVDEVQNTLKKQRFLYNRNC